MGIHIKRDTAANWTTNNTILLDGQPAYETDTLKMKFGDGVTEWNSLSYTVADGGGTEYTFENGLTELSGNVKLGGDLIENITISGAYDVTFSNLTGFSVITSDASGSTGIQLINPTGTGGFQIYHGAASDFQIVSSGGATSFDIEHYGSGTMTITAGNPSDLVIQKNAEDGGAFTIQKNGGSDPFTIANNGDGDMIIEKNSTDGIFSITQNGNGGLQIKNNGVGGITLDNDNSGLMNIVSGGGIVFENISGGDTLVQNTSDAGALFLKAQTADTTKQISIILNGYNGIIQDDTDNQHGLKYQSDYSATYDERSLVDKAYVDSVAGGGGGGGFDGTAGASQFSINSTSTTTPILTIKNIDATDVGDSFIRFNINGSRSYAIGIDNSNDDFVISGVSGSGAHLDNSYIMRGTWANLNVNPAVTFNSSLYVYGTLAMYTGPAEYTSDFSGSYTDRSLVDKGYVDNVVDNVAGGGGMTEIISMTSNTNADDSMHGKIIVMDTSSYTPALNLPNGLTAGLTFEMIVHGSNNGQITADNVFCNTTNPTGTGNQYFNPGTRVRITYIGSSVWYATVMQ